LLGRQLLTFEVRGLNYTNRLRLLLELRSGMQVQLEREPTNKDDANAIRVLLPNGLQLGYVPGEIARILAPILDTGVRAEARLAGVRVPSYKPPYGFPRISLRLAPVGRDKA
jgi:hypothetical protein